MKRILFPLLATLLLGLFGVVLAEYKSEDDVTLTLDGPLVSDVADAAGVGSLGDALFDAQEGVHDTLTRTTGIEIDHSYVRLCLGRRACLPIDPFTLSR